MRFTLALPQESLEVLCICNNLGYATTEETKEFYAVEKPQEAPPAAAEGEAKAEEA